MQIIVGMETSGEIRERLRNLGWAAFSVDMLPADDASPYHIQGDVFDYCAWPGLLAGVFHPTCTFLTYAAEWAYKDPDFTRYPGKGYHQKVKPGTLTGAARRQARVEALRDVRRLMMLPYPKMIENPRGAICKHIRPATQTVQPYEFGDDASKATCLWWDQMPALRIDPAKRKPGRIVKWKGQPVERWANQSDSGQNRAPERADRWKERSKTFPGIADAVAQNIHSFLLFRGFQPAARAL